MTMYVYATDGRPRGFLFETTIYALGGEPLGRLVGRQVHRFDGSYVGEWFHQMVVTRPYAQPRRLARKNRPPARPPVPSTTPRRDVAEYRSFPDAFDLFYGNDAEWYDQAAE